MASHFLSDPNTMLTLFLMDWRGCFRWWRYFLILREFSQVRQYRRTYASCEINNNNFFSRLLEDKVRVFSSDCGCCWIGMSQNTCVLIVGMRFMCYQRSHFYSYRYRCRKIKFNRRVMSSGGSASTWMRWSGLAEVLSNDTVENAQISLLRWPRGQRVLHGEVLGCDFAKYSVLRWRESANTTLKWKHVLRDLESKILGRAASSAEIVLQFIYSFQHLKYFNWRQRPPWFLTPTLFLSHSPFSRVLAATLCQCILSTFCPILSLTSPGLSRFREP